MREIRRKCQSRDEYVSAGINRNAVSFVLGIAAQIAGVRELGCADIARNELGDKRRAESTGSGGPGLVY